MDEDEQSSIVQSLRGGGPAPLARPLLDNDEDDDHAVEALFEETARAQRRATDLESASPPVSYTHLTLPTILLV